MYLKKLGYLYLDIYYFLSSFFIVYLFKILFMKSNQLIVLFIFSMTIFFVSCKDQTFAKTKNATLDVRSLDGSSSVKIKSYTVTYNPKSNGFIKLELESGAEYQAKSIDGGSFSSINLLLKERGVLFDTLRKELIIAQNIQY